MVAAAQRAEAALQPAAILQGAVAVQRFQIEGLLPALPHMMLEGKIVYDVSGEEKKNLQVSDLLEKFHTVSGDDLANDRMLLS